MAAEGGVNWVLCPRNGLCCVPGMVAIAPVVSADMSDLGEGLGFTTTN